MKISCIIPAYNAERFLERAVDSLVATGYPDLEIVIVDDGSKDNTLSIARQIVSRLPSVVRLLRHPDQGNHGVSASRNLGVRECTGQLVCFLDADDSVLTHRFDIAVNILRLQTDIDAVHERARMEFEGERGAERFWDADDQFGIDPGVPAQETLKALLRGACWPTSGILVRRSVFERCGFFPEDYRYAEDYHLWLRLACVARVVPGNPNPVSVYHRHSDNTYHGGLERKNDVIRAMTEVHAWLRRGNGDLADKAEFTRGVTAYVRNALIQTREARQTPLGRQIIATVARNRFIPTVRDPASRRQMLWVILGRTAPHRLEISLSA